MGCVAASLDDLLATNKLRGVVELLFEENEEALCEAASYLRGRVSVCRLRSALSLLRGEKRSLHDREGAPPRPPRAHHER